MWRQGFAMFGASVLPAACTDWDFDAANDGTMCSLCAELMPRPLPPRGASIRQRENKALERGNVGKPEAF